MYKYLFGPVPSRRLGMSLGVDLVPRKVCSLDCVYCEVADTTRLTLERKEYIPYAKIADELEQYFSSSPDPDYITFSGYGEPTLNSRIGDVISFIKQQRPQLPVAVLTNGTLLHDPQVRSELSRADLVLPSLDAATEEVFVKINHPAGEINFQDYVQGLIAFSKEFSGKIWLEVFILPGYNDSDAHLTALKDIILKIAPDSVQLNTLDRPGRLADLRGATKAELRRILDFLDMDNALIISTAPQRKKIKSYRLDAETAIMETIARRPCTLIDLCQILGMHGNEINKYLDILDSEGKIVAVHQERGIFYQKK
ncbi:MAG: radical SAM protein [Desulfuromonas sp.]|nr:MAG: radical SAM protein [Desulfuromonas sp.]